MLPVISFVNTINYFSFLCFTTWRGSVVWAFVFVSIDSNTIKEKISMQITLETQNEIKEAAYVIAGLSIPDKKRFLKHLFEKMNPDIKKELAAYVFKQVYGTKNLEIEHRMEKMFKKNMNLTPKKVASMVRYYMRINEQMMPYLIATARRVKNKMYKREVRKNTESLHSKRASTDN